MGLALSTITHHVLATVQAGVSSVILIDRRQGSGHLAKRWPEATLTDLTVADVAILGRGPDGVGMSCGIEIKGLAELLGDMHSGRFLGRQAPALRRSYDYAWLIVQGHGRRRRDGVLEIPRKGGWAPLSFGQSMSAKPFLHVTAMTLIMTIAQKAGIFVWPTDTEGQTLWFLKYLAAWWTNGWDSHKSLDTFYQPPSGHIPHEHTLLRLWLKEIRGIGWTRSALAEPGFTSAQAMANAEPEDFASIKGISAKRAQEIVNEIRGIV